MKSRGKEESLLQEVFTLIEKWNRLNDQSKGEARLTSWGLDEFGVCLDKDWVICAGYTLEELRDILVELTDTPTLEEVTAIFDGEFRRTYRKGEIALIKSYLASQKTD
jgi:hypothetical protein